MKDFFPLLKGYKVKAILAPFLKLGEVVLELSVPFVVASVIDEGIPSANVEFVLQRFGLLLLFGVLGLGFACTAQYFSAKAASVFSARIKKKLFCHIESLEYDDFLSYGEGEWMTLLTADVHNVQTGLNLFLRLLLRSPFVVGGAIVASFLIDTKSACIFAVIVPVLTVFAFFVLYFGIRLFRKTQSGLKAVTEGARQTRSGAKVFRALSASNDAAATFDVDNRRYAKAQTRSALFSAVLDPFSFTVINLAVVLLLWQGGVRVRTGDLTQGQTVALYNYSALILTELIKFASLIITVSRAVASGKRIQKAWTLPVRKERNGVLHTDAETVFSFRDVSFRYRDASGDAVEHVSFEVKKGQKIGIIGGFGSGKSTLLDLASRVYEPTSGKIELFGEDITDVATDSIRSCIGYAVQKAELFSGSMEENVLFGQTADWGVPVEKAQASDVVRAKGGIGAFVTQGGGNLSGGQRQRIALARAFVGEKPVLLLDDSSSALDAKTAENLYETVFCKNGQTLLFCSQRVAAVRKADLILVLKDGKTQGFDTHEHLLKTCKTYQEIYEAQYEEN